MHQTPNSRGSAILGLKMWFSQRPRLYVEISEEAWRDKKQSKKYVKFTKRGRWGWWIKYFKKQLETQIFFVKSAYEEAGDRGKRRNKNVIFPKISLSRWCMKYFKMLENNSIQTMKITRIYVWDKKLLNIIFL